MNSYINPPNRIPLFLRLGIWIAEKSTGKRMVPARLLSWVPKSALGSGLLEALVIHKDKTISNRLLKLVRLQTSFFVSCPFCIDMNGSDIEKHGISEFEIRVLQGVKPIFNAESFDEREKTALEYARLISRTPMRFSPAFIEKLKRNFDSREIVVLSTTVSQVNYWARLIQALGIPPAGFSDSCDILTLDDYRTIDQP